MSASSDCQLKKSLWQQLREDMTEELYTPRTSTTLCGEEVRTVRFQVALNAL